MYKIYTIRAVQHNNIFGRNNKIDTNVSYCVFNMYNIRLYVSLPLVCYSPGVDPEGPEETIHKFRLDCIFCEIQRLGHHNRKQDITTIPLTDENIGA
jgi:hypothetical protein